MTPTVYALLSRWHRFRGPVARTPARVAFARPWPSTRRGFALWLLSLAMIFLGLVNYVATDLPEPTRQTLVFALTLSGGSAAVWGWTFVAVGAFSLWCSYCHFGRDRYGYIAVSVFTAGWGLGYVAGALFLGGGLRGLGGAIIWLLFSAIFATVAGFPNVRMGAPPPILAADSDTPRGRVPE